MSPTTPSPLNANTTTAPFSPAWARSLPAYTSSAATRPFGTASSHNGVYDVLRRDPAALSQQAVSTIDALWVVRRRAQWTAFLGRILGLSLLAAGLLLLGLQASAVVHVVQTCPVPFPGSMQTCVAGYYQSGAAVSIPWAPVVAAGLVVAVLYTWAVRTTIVTIDKGLLQIEKGVLRRRLVTVYLWRVSDVELKQTCLNRLTGDGTLILRLSGSRVVKVRGLARRTQLRDECQMLLHLTSLLRANPLVTGIVG